MDDQTFEPLRAAALDLVGDAGDGFEGRRYVVAHMGAVGPVGVGIGGVVSAGDFLAGAAPDELAAGELVPFVVARDALSGDRARGLDHRPRSD